MTTLRDKYQIICEEIDFKVVVQMIDEFKIDDVNQQDEKGRSLLFYMIDQSYCCPGLTVDFINKYKPRFDICDIYGQTIFYRATSIIKQAVYDEYGFPMLMDFILFMTPNTILLKKDNGCRSVVEYLSQKMNDLRGQVGPVLSKLSRRFYDVDLMFHRLRYILNQVVKFINKRCTLFELMYCEYEDKINKKQRF